MNGRQNALHIDRSGNVYTRVLLTMRKVFIVDTSNIHRWKAETISCQNTPVSKNFEAPVTPLYCVRKTPVTYGQNVRPTFVQGEKSIGPRHF